MLFRYYIMQNMTEEKLEKQSPWKWLLLQYPFCSSRWIFHVFWWRKEGNIAWAAWEQVDQELLHQMTEKNFLLHYNFSYASGKVTTKMLFLPTPREKVGTRERKRQKTREEQRQADTSSRATCALSNFPFWCSTGLYEVLAHAGVGERLICTFWRVERERREGDQ